MRESLRHFVAEFVGTFGLVFIGGGAIMMAQQTNSQASLLAVATAHGLALALGVTATMRISGHLNPAVTIGLLVTRRIGAPMAGVHIAAQLIGAIVAAKLLQYGFPPAVVTATQVGGQSVALDVTTMQAITLEAIATFFLMFMVYATAVDPDGPKVGGFAIGLMIAADILAIGPLTGASMNPARSFGPAVARGVYEGQMVYWVGPILGAIAASMLYEYVLLGRAEPATAGDASPSATPPAPAKSKKTRGE